MDNYVDIGSAEYIDLERSNKELDSYKCNLVSCLLTSLDLKRDIARDIETLKDICRNETGIKI